MPTEQNQHHAPGALGNSYAVNRRNYQGHLLLLPARRYASAGTNYGPVSDSLSESACLKSVFYQKKWKYYSGFGMETFSDQSYSVFWENSGIYKNTDTSLWNFFLNSGLRKFDSAYRSSNALSTQLERCRRSERDKLDSRRSTKLIIRPSTDDRPL